MQHRHQLGHRPAGGERGRAAPLRVQVRLVERVLDHVRAGDQAHPRPQRHPRREADAVAHHARDLPDHAAEQAHQEGHGAEAVRDHVDPPPPDVAAELGERRGVVVAREVVEGEPVGRLVVRQPVAHPGVQRPHLAEPVVQQVADQIPVLGHDEHVHGRGQAVHQQHHVVGVLAAEAGQVQAEAVHRGDRVNAHIRVAYTLECVQRDFPVHRAPQRLGGWSTSP